MKRVFYILMTTLLALAVAGPVSADTAAGTTTLAFSSNPATVSGSAAADVTITTTTSAGSHTDKIDDGKVIIEVATDNATEGAGNLVSSSYAGTIYWDPLNAPGQNPSGASHETSLALDLDGLLATYGAVAPITVAFRAHYVTGGGSHKIDTHFSSAVDLVINLSSSCGAPGVTVGATLATGNGAPAPGASGPWTFRISVTNCTGVNLTGVKVQGGSNGWAPATGWTPSTGSVSVRQNNRNQVLTWTVDIADGATVTLDVTVDGTIPVSAPDGQIRYLSGAWSAVYDAGSGPQKSAYSGRVFITVTVP